MDLQVISFSLKPKHHSIVAIRIDPLAHPCRRLQHLQVLMEKQLTRILAGGEPEGGRLEKHRLFIAVEKTMLDMEFHLLNFIY